MIYRLEHSSAWTVYTVKFYPSVEECERDCLDRYKQTVCFIKNKVGVLEASVFGDDDVILRLYEVDGAVNAS